MKSGAVRLLSVAGKAENRQELVEKGAVRTGSDLAAKMRARGVHKHENASFHRVRYTARNHMTGGKQAASSTSKLWDILFPVAETGRETWRCDCQHGKAPQIH